VCDQPDKATMTGMTSEMPILSVTTAKAGVSNTSADAVSKHGMTSNIISEAT